MNSESNIDATARIVAAYLSTAGCSTTLTGLPGLIRSVRAVLAESDEAVPAAELKPAVPIKKSVTPDYLVCLEDGKKLKMLKRYVKARFNLTPEEYRAKWGLPRDYPMVCANYSAKRSEFAKENGLGKSRVKGARK